MTFDFEHVPQRLNTDSQKWQKYAGRDILPLWVADMDFKSSPAIVAALQHRVAEGFGHHGNGDAAGKRAAHHGVDTGRNRPDGPLRGRAGQQRR